MQIHCLYKAAFAACTGTSPACAVTVAAALALGACDSRDEPAFETASAVANSMATADARGTHRADPVYLPSLFPPPAGEIEALPAQF